MSKSSQTYATVLRLLAGLIILASGALALPPQFMDQVPHVMAWLGFIIAVAIAASLLAMASIIRRENVAPPETSQALTRLGQQAMELDAKLRDLQMMSERLSRTSPTNAHAGSGRDYTEQFHQISVSISELRQIALLPDADRRQIATRQRNEKKTSLVDQLFGMVGAHEWSKAERLLLSLEAEFPNDDDVLRGRSYLNHSRSLFETEAVAEAVREIEELMLTASWDRALERVRQLLQGFPTSGDAHALQTRVEREYQIYRETNVQRLFDEIRRDLDSRSWRSALGRAKQLIELYPNHRFAEHMRGQMKTLTDNAEIEERQEIEIRIQEYLRDGKFEQALELGEDLMRRFPHSPQADSLETMLPKIRELAKQGLSEFSGMSPDVNPFRIGTPIKNTK